MKRAVGPLRRTFRDLPLVAKLLVPSLVLIVIAGAGGGGLIARDLSARARTALNQELLQQSLTVRAELQNSQLYLLESVSLAANLEGMAAAVSSGDRARATELLRSVAALKSDLSVFAVWSGRDPVAGLQRARPGRRPARGIPRVEPRERLARLDAGARGDRWVDLFRVEGRALLGAVSPVCRETGRCNPVGIALTGVWVDDLLAAGPSSSSSAVALYDDSGKVLAATGAVPREPIEARARSAEAVRRTERVRGEDVAVLYAPWQINERRRGTIALAVPVEPALAALRGTGLLLASILVAAVAGIALVGWAVSRAALAQVRPLLQSSRALGGGDLDARAPVLGSDELGELARHFNEMARRLQASHENLELLVSQRTEEIQRLLRERTAFFASVTHELRTPVAIMLSRAKMMQNPAFSASPRDHRDATHTIIESGEQLLHVVNDMLELARAESGKLDLDLEAVSVADVIAQARRTMEGLASGRDIVLTADVAADLPAARADARRLREVLLSLVDNAVKYTPSGGRVEIDAHAAGDVVRIAVSDTGISVPPDVGERIFEPFYRAPGAATQHGEAASGLGLALARRLVDAMGGRLDYAPRANAGTTFTIELAVAKQNGRGRRAANPRTLTPSAGT